MEMKCLYRLEKLSLMHEYWKEYSKIFKATLWKGGRNIVQMGELSIHKVIAFIIPSSAEAGPDGASLDKWASRKFKVTLTKFEVSLDYMI